MRNFKNVVFLFLIGLYLFLLPLTSLSYAQDEANLDTGDEKTYCDGKTLVRKFGCRYAKQYSWCDLSADFQPDCGRNKAVWVCNYERVTSDTCITPGGISQGSNALEGVFGQIKPPPAIAGFGYGKTGLSNLIQKIIQLLFVIAAAGFVIMFLWSAVSMIISGGDKEAVAKAKGRLTWALIGIVLMAFAFTIFRILQGILGISIVG